MRKNDIVFLRLRKSKSILFMKALKRSFQSEINSLPESKYTELFGYVIEPKSLLRYI